MLLATDRKAQFQRDGYVVLEDCFSAAYMAEAKEEVRRILAEVRADAQAKGQTPKRENGVYVGLSVRSAFFRKLNADPRLVDVLAEAIGPNLEFWSDKVVYKAPGVDFGSPWHQDWMYWKGAHKYSVWIAMDDATPANGCLRIIPGSHTQAVEHGGQDAEGVGFNNRLREGALDESKMLDLPAKAGTAVLFHDLLLHASYPNTTGKDRWALIPTYRDLSQDDFDYGFATAAFTVRGTRTGKSLGPAR